MVADEKTKEAIVNAAKQVPLSDATTMHPVQALDAEVLYFLLKGLKGAEVLLAIDEPDNKNIAQLCFYDIL